MTQAKQAGVTVLVAEQLADELEGKLSRDEIEEVVEAHAEDFADAKVPNFVSTFVARRAREDLEPVFDRPRRTATRSTRAGAARS